MTSISHPRDNYARMVDNLKDHYEDRIMLLMETIKAALTLDGIDSEGPFFEDGNDCYEWNLFTHNPDVDITFEIAESRACEGTDEGINFSIHVVEQGGCILGELSPYNYTPKVWVSFDSPTMIEERFRIMEYVDVDKIVELVKGSNAKSN